MKTKLLLLLSALFPLFCFAQDRPFLILPALNEDMVGNKPNKELLYADVSTTPRAIKSLNVVVHLMGTNTIHFSDADVEEIIQNVTLDFRRMNADTADTPDVYKPLAADTEIEFHLATIDPDGNPTTGITRTPGLGILDFSSQQHILKNDSLGGKSAWDTDYYVNIWIAAFVDVGGAVIFSPGNPYDGVALNNIGNPSPYYSRFVTYFLGYHLGLINIFGAWEPGCEPDNFGDGIDDTPDQYTFSTEPDCPVFPVMDQCTPDYPGIMFMNFMNWTNGNCTNMFTIGQAEQMCYVLENFRPLLLIGFTANEEIKEESTITVFPNPAHDKLFIRKKGQSFKSGIYSLFNQLGQMVLQQAINTESSTTEMDISFLSPGVYWLHGKDAKNAATLKVVKQ